MELLQSKELSEVGHEDHLLYRRGLRILEDLYGLQLARPHLQNAVAHPSPRPQLSHSEANSFGVGHLHLASHRSLQVGLARKVLNQGLLASWGSLKSQEYTRLPAGNGPLLT